MKNFKIKLTLIVLLCTTAISCDKEDQFESEFDLKTETISSTANDNIIADEIIETEDAIENTKVALLSRSRKGKFVELFKKYNVETFSVRSTSENIQAETGFLYIDVDDFTNDINKADNIINNAQSKGLNLIIESGSNNRKNLNDFLLGNFDISENMEALIIINKADKSDFIPIDEINFDQSIFDVFSDLFSSHLPEEDLTISSNIFKNSEPNLSAKETYSYKNTTDDSALSAAKKKYGGGSSCSWSYKGEKWLEQPNASLKKAGKAYYAYLKKGEIHDAIGKCQNQQTASYSNSFAVSKTWGVRVSGKIEFNGPFWKVGVDVSKSWGGGKTNSTTNGSSLKMRRRYAQAWIRQKVQLYSGGTTGRRQLSYKVSCKGEGKSETVYVNIRYDGWAMQTTQPVGKQTYGWAQWGAWLKKCK